MMAVIYIRHLTRVVALGAALLLAACSVLPEPVPMDIYLLPAGGAAVGRQQARPALQTALRVLRPVAGAQLSGSRIVVLPQDGVLSVYKGASWSDPAPVLVRNRLVDALRASGHMVAISTDERTLHADYELDSDLRAFQSEYRGNQPEAVVALEARLVETGTRRIVASQRFEVHEPAAGKEVLLVVQAMGRATDRLSEQLVTWITQRLER